MLGCSYDRSTPPQPANVLVEASGHVCHSDLGLAAFVSNPWLRASITAKMAPDGDRRTSDSRASGTSAGSASSGGLDLRHSAVEVNGRIIRPYLRGKAGTPGYWAPEMLVASGADGKPPAYDGSADLWSLGCLAYALLAGRGPFW